MGRGDREDGKRSADSKAYVAGEEDFVWVEPRWNSLVACELLYARVQQKEGST